MKTHTQYTKPAALAVAVGAGVVATASDEVYASDFECAYIPSGDCPTSLDQEVTPVAHTTVRIPIQWNEAAKLRFKELTLLKAKRQTTEEQDSEFMELYDAREDSLDRSTSEQRVMEFKRKQAFRELLSAFDHYVATEKVTT